MRAALLYCEANLAYLCASVVWGKGSSLDIAQLWLTAVGCLHPRVRTAVSDQLTKSRAI